ncbi:universal stress protein [Micrococcales bacterium 31B]|nr:universal stress protein [Micrococcales bacterium 31B]
MTIIAGNIHTPEGKAALSSAIAQAHQRGSDLVVVEEGGDAVGAQISDYLESLKHEHPQVKVKRRPFVAEWDLTENILHAATEESADLIVVGIRKRSKVGKLNLGSNMQKLLLQSPCEVLAVKCVIERPTAAS